MQQSPLPHQRFWRWFRHLSRRTQIIGCGVLLFSCVLCTGITVAGAGKGNQTTPVAVATASPTIAPTAAQTAANTVATPTTPIPTLPPLPTPTSTPVPTPTPQSIHYPPATVDDLCGLAA